MFSVQAASQGGQIRPVKSGKLLVECRTAMASRQLPRNTRSFQSGMMLFTGQPLLQKGTPQSMQRAPCLAASSSLQVIDELLCSLETPLDRGVGLGKTLYSKSGWLAHRRGLLLSVAAPSRPARDGIRAALP